MMVFPLYNDHYCGKPFEPSRVVVIKPARQALLRGFAEESRDGPVINTCCHGEKVTVWMLTCGTYIYIYTYICVCILCIWHYMICMYIYVYIYPFDHIFFKVPFLAIQILKQKNTMFAMGGSVASRMSLRMSLASQVFDTVHVSKEPEKRKQPRQEE